MNYKKVLKNTLLLAPLAILNLQTPVWGAEATKTATCQKASPAVDKEGVPLPPVVGKEGARSPLKTSPATAAQRPTVSLRPSKINH
ncbi:TPA: hypothetical protein ACTY1G_000044 [Klebsiella michiganensis]|uniref:hypothetical protein n=1 Tax=Klebsiella michiganensis TaxID=1134687 RepID=UPI001E431701|nr:hypothetical protein [Klebsiella michiganensis]